MVTALAVASTSALAAADPWDFRGPFGVAVDSGDVIYVAEVHNRRIARFTLDGQWLEPITEVAGYGPLAGPYAVTIGPDDQLYITDTLNHKIVVLDADGQLVFVLGGRAGNRGDAPFTAPPCIAVDSGGQIFVPDPVSSRIFKFTSEGRSAGAWGTVGHGPGQFLHPNDFGGIATDDRGFLYVRENRGRRVHKYTEKGEYVLTISGQGVKADMPGVGYGVAVLRGELWIPETTAGRIRICSLDGLPLDTWDGGARFTQPVGIAATRTGDLIVSDWNRNRVVRLDPAGRLVDAWGRSIDDALAYAPPARIPRGADRPVRFSLYGGASDADLLACRDARIGRIYAPLHDSDNPRPFAETVAKAASLGIAVHPSIAMLTGGPAGERFIRQHPEQCMWRKDSREPLKSMLSWAQPAARRHRVESVVNLVVASGVDGVMLDQMHYIDTDCGYDPIAIDGFFRNHGINPLAVPMDDPRWLRYRADFITDFLVVLRRRLAAREQGVHLSVFGSGDGTPDSAMRTTMKDWRTWARMGIADTVQAAPYTRDMSRIYETVRRTRTEVPARTRINCFLACDSGNLSTPALLRKGCDVAIAAGADEVTLYRTDAIAELGLWEAVAEIVADAHRVADASQ